MSSAGFGRRVLGTFAFSAAGQLIGIAHQLLLVPFFLRAWGDEAYGDWLAATAVASYLTLTDMGVQTYVVNRLTQEHARGETASFRVTLHSAWALYSMLALAGLVVVAGLAVFLPWGPWFDGHALGPAIARSVATVSALSVLLGVATGFVAGTHKAFGDPARSAAQNSLVRLWFLVLSLVALVFRATPTALAWALLAGQGLALAAVLADALRRHPEVRPSFAAADRSSVKAFLAPSLLFLLMQLALGLTVQGTVIVASVALGGAAAASFATVRTLVNVVRQAVQLIGNSLWPELTRLESTGDRTLPTVHRLLVKATCLVTATLVPALAVAGPALYAAWTGGRVAMDEPLLRWLLLGMALQAPWLASAVVLVASNRHSGLAGLYLLQGVVAVGLSAVLAPRFGTQAMGIALASTDFVVFGFLVPKWTQHVTGESFGRYVREIYLPYALVLVLSGAAAAGAAQFAAGLAVVVATVLPFVAATAVSGAALVPWLQGDERAFIARWVGRFRGGRRAG